MNIIVCVKQVPNVAAIKFDREAKTIVPRGRPASAQFARP